MKVITIGKRLVPVEQVAFVEPFDPSSNPEFKPEKAFKGRVVLLNREKCLQSRRRRTSPPSTGCICSPRTVLRAPRVLGAARL